MTTTTLALMFGIYILAGGAGIVFRPAKMDAVFEDMENHPALTYTIGAFVFFLGALILSVHRSWASPLEGMVTFVGWAAAIKGVLFLVWPGLMIQLGKMMISGVSSARISGLLAMVFGGALTVYALMA